MSQLDFHGALYFPALLSPERQRQLVAIIDELVAVAPLFQPVMPRTGRPFSVQMTNFGDVGWVSDRNGYRYQPFHPDTNAPWPPIPPEILAIWREVSPKARQPDACLVNYYASTARMGMHQDSDERDMTQPVVSVSLGDTAIFRMGGPTRKSPTRSMPLRSGDVIVLAGDARGHYHGIDRLQSGSSQLLKQGGRYNLTMRRAL